MDPVSKALLIRQGVSVFAGASVGLDVFSREEFHQRYDEAFRKADSVVVAIDEYHKIVLTGDVDQLWENRGMFSGRGITVLLQIPKELWEELKTQLPEEIHDLRMVAA